MTTLFPTDQNGLSDYSAMRYLLKRYATTGAVTVLWLFTHADGSRAKGNRKAWARVLKAAGLNPELRFHDLRRTAAVNMADHNVDERWSMALMGHKTRSMHDRYKVAKLSSLREAAKGLDKPVAAQQPPQQAAQVPQAQGQAVEADGHSSGMEPMPKAVALGGVN